MGENGQNAIQVILEGNRFQGQMESIQNISKILDKGFVWYISIAAFCIIGFAMMRNVTAALYCSFPRFFDTLSMWKEALQNKKNGENRALGVGASILAALIPDVKYYTDFYNLSSNPKDYWTKALPQLFVFTILGVFIFNGYARDVVMQGATLADYFLVKIISVNPVAAFEKTFNSVTGQKSIHAQNETPQGIAMNKLSKAVYGRLVGDYPSIKGDKRTLNETIGKIDQITKGWISGAPGDMKEVVGLDNWTFHVTDAYISSEALQPSETDFKKTYIKSSGYNTITYVFSTPVSAFEGVDFGPNGGDHLNVVGVLKEKALKGTTVVGTRVNASEVLDMSQSGNSIVIKFKENLFSEEYSGHTLGRTGNNADFKTAKHQINVKQGNVDGRPAILLSIDGEVPLTIDALGRDISQVFADARLTASFSYDKSSIKVVSKEGSSLAEAIAAIRKKSGKPDSGKDGSGTPELPPQKP